MALWRATRVFTPARASLFSRSYCSDTVNLIYVNPDGSEVPVKAKKGENLLKIAHQNEIDLEGACECSLACSTCHIILPEEIYDQLEEPTDEEYDMLDLAFGLTETSRLGCQVEAQDVLEGVRIQLPTATRNMAVDGFKPKPH
uniref:2Fe-2S ferredoxin n=1 Tax=Paramoeba aestuarina TaxID=180227 RepID=A0A7S4P7T3_9EUKA